MLESVYRKALAYELRKHGLLAEEEYPIEVSYDDVSMGIGFRIDIWVERRYVLELKVERAIIDDHIAQTLSYFRFSKTKFGIILNFMEIRLHPKGIKRLIYDPAYFKKNYQRP